MYDGVLFATFNHQGGPRGGRRVHLDRLAHGHGEPPGRPGPIDVDRHGQPRTRHDRPAGYRELFQVGRDVPFHPDRRSAASARPADAGVRRVADSAHRETAITFAGAPVGEAALGPVAFMHRRSAAENPVAPLSHHTLDSTHIAMGVIAVAVDRGPWVFESSVFQSGEPDDNRWDLVDFGAARFVVGPRRRTSRRLPGNCRGRTGFSRIPNGSSSRRCAARRPRRRGSRPGRMDLRPRRLRSAGTTRSFTEPSTPALAEATRRQGRLSLYGRLESVEVETDLLQTRGLFHSHTRWRGIW